MRRSISATIILLITSITSVSWSDDSLPTSDFAIIPIVAHVLVENESTKQNAKNDIENSLKLVNDNFKNVGMHFDLCDVRFIEKTGFEGKYGVNPDTKFGFSAMSKVANKNNEENVVNIYSFSDAEASKASAPHDKKNDFVGMHTPMLPNRQTLSHELGHYFGLIHTFENGWGWGAENVDGTDCAYKGDWVCDTSMDRISTNMMSYGTQGPFHFSSKQSEMMNLVYMTEKRYLSNGCGNSSEKFESRTKTSEINDSIKGKQTEYSGIVAYKPEFFCFYDGSNYPDYCKDRNNLFDNIKDTTLPESYTKEAWVMLSSPENGKSNNIISGSNSSKHALWIAKENGFKLAAGHNGTWNSVIAKTSFPSGWHHVAVTYDASTKTMKLYQDGELVSTKEGVPKFQGDGTVRLGNFGGVSMLDGEIRHPRIWGYARTEQQIRENATGVTVSAANQVIKIEQASQSVNLKAAISSSYTKEAWVMLSSPENGKSNNIISGSNSSKHALWIAKENGFKLAAGHNGTWNSVIAKTSFPSGWHHVAVTYDGVSNTMNLFQDGELVSTREGVFHFIGDGSMHIGSYNSSNELNGEVKIVKIWDYARTEKQIETNFKKDH